MGNYTYFLLFLMGKRKRKKKKVVQIEGMHVDYFHARLKYVLTEFQPLETRCVTFNIKMIIFFNIFRVCLAMIFKYLEKWVETFFEIITETNS